MGKVYADDETILFWANHVIDSFKSFPGCDKDKPISEIRKKYLQQVGRNANHYGNCIEPIDRLVLMGEFNYEANLPITSVVDILKTEVVDLLEKEIRMANGK